MCGILGEYTYQKRSEERRSLLQTFVNSLRHRGPDGGACWSDGPFFLGHRRLSIIDLSPQGKQPMATAGGDLVVTFNGEIYNYIELRQELASLGYQFQTHSDTEVLLHGYREWSHGLPKKLIGMFAFALADRRRKELFLARDRFGEKPLLYVEEPTRVTFASEVRPLAVLLGEKRELNECALPSYLCLNYVPGNETLMKGVRRVRPGTWRLYRSSGEVQTGTFWAPPTMGDVDSSLTIELAIEQLEALLDNAVRLTLRSDVPVGIFLSGGVDSSLVSQSAARSGRLSRAYCLTFEEKTYSEWDKAQETARQLEIPLTKVVLTSQALGEFLEIVEHADDPLADSSSLAVWTLSRQAAQHNKVVLGGDGGDELFAGYLTYKATLLHRQIASILPMPLRKLLASLGEKIPTSEAKVSRSYQLMRFLRAIDLPSAQAHFTWNGVWLPTQVGEFLSSISLKHQASSCLEALARQNGVVDPPNLRSLQAADVLEYLPNDILVKVDRMSMAHGLEVRAPFLEPTLAEFALSLPSRFKTSIAGPSKRILRELASRSYGVQIAHAKKQGFSIPIHGWLRGPAREMAEELLSENSVREVPALDPSRITQVLREHMSGRRSYGFELWGLMVLMAWHRARIQNSFRIPKEWEPVERLRFEYQPQPA